MNQLRNIVIRNAIVDDCPLLVELIRELAVFEKLEHEMAADAATIKNSLFGKNAKAYALIAEAGGKTAGFCIYFYNFSTFVGRPGIYIEDIYVREEYRKLGIGKQIFARIGEIAKAENCGRIEWWVLDWNKNAIDFYTRLGAKAMSEWTVYRITQDKFSKLVMEKAA
jgi:GNAT superfamily N-acetyltransferase